MLDYGFYNMDCMEGMKDFPDDYFDLAIVDPPYGAGFTEGGGCKGWFTKYHRNGETNGNVGGVVLLNYDNAEDVSLVYTCFRTNKVLVNPLINWTDDEVWRCINDNHLPINPLYGCGFWRVGCVGCPMAGDARYRDFERYPKYRDRYIWIADQIVKEVRERKKQSKITFKNGLEYFKNWIQNDDCIGQFAFDEDGNITEEWVI